MAKTRDNYYVGHYMRSALTVEHYLKDEAALDLLALLDQRGHKRSELDPSHEMTMRIKALRRAGLISSYKMGGVSHYRTIRLSHRLRRAVDARANRPSNLIAA